MAASEIRNLMRFVSQKVGINVEEYLHNQYENWVGNIMLVLD